MSDRNTTTKNVDVKIRPQYVKNCGYCKIAKQNGVLCHCLCHKQDITGNGYHELIFEMPLEDRNTPIKKAGRKPKSRQIGISNYLPVSLYLITWAPKLLRGSTRDFRDKNGKLEFSPTRQIRQSTNKIFSNLEEANLAKADLEKRGYKKVKILMDGEIDLPRACPKCQRFGTPGIITYKIPYKINDKRLDQESNPDQDPKQKETKKLIYNHNPSQEKPKTCYIGEVIHSDHFQIKPKAGIPHDWFSYVRRVKALTSAN